MSKETTPSQAALRFLRWICPDILYESIEGDLLEQFDENVKTVGEKKAKRRFIGNVLKFCRPGIILRNKILSEFTQPDMIRNYFSMAWRHLVKDKTFSLISIFGLSVSVAVCLLIFQYAFFELHYDEFNKDSAWLYRLGTHQYENNHVVYESALASPLIAPALKEKLPEIAQTGRLFPTRAWFNCTLSYTHEGNITVYNESHLFYADPQIISMLGFHIEQGNEKQALEKPYSAVISSSVARKYFGKENAIGKILHLKGSNDEHDYTVTAIITDLQTDSHLDADILLSASSFEHSPRASEFDAYTYILLMPGADMKTLATKLRDFISVNLPTKNNEKSKTLLSLLPLTDIHLFSTLQDEIKAVGNVRSIYFLLLTAFCILAIAWINYINLATSRSISRAKEVGIRKAIGANRGQLIKQFLSESIIIHTVSIVSAIILIYLLAPVFYTLTGLSVSYTRFFELAQGSTGLFITFVFFAGILLSGLYPAKIISSHNPALVLKGKVVAMKNGFQLRKVLVVFQFTCAITLTISIVTFNQQFSFMLGKDLGIDITRTLVIKAPNAFNVHVDSSYLNRLTDFRSTLQEQSLIASITSSSAIPGGNGAWTGPVRKNNDETTPLDVLINVVDQDFISSYHLHLLAGRNFQISDYPSGRFGSKTEPVILNRLAVKQLGYAQPGEAIGDFIYWGNNKCLVVGVIDDFHLQSLKNALQPILLTAYQGPNLSLKLGSAVNADNLAKSISFIHETWETFFPEYAFDYFFLEDFYNNQYAHDKQVSNLFHLFCGLALVISSLGLFALSSLTVKQRAREMSIRKVMGAPVASLFGLLTKDFAILIFISSCLAMPLSYVGMMDWLQAFAFHISITAWVFILPVLIVMLIALFTIGFQALHTALANPVDTLKNE